MNGKVSKTQRLTKNVVHSIIEGFEPFAITPGQFVMVDVLDGQKRAYGVSNAPTNGKVDKLELFVDTTPGGPGSRFFDKLKEGKTFSFTGPYGEFMISTEQAPKLKKIVFLATGTGIAPIKALVEALTIGDYKPGLDQMPTRDIRLFFGLRYAEDLFLQDYFRKLENQSTNLSFVCTLSRPTPAWKGASGYITEHLLKSSIALKEYDYFICGARDTSEKIIDLLKSHEIPQERLHFEHY